MGAALIVLLTLVWPQPLKADTYDEAQYAIRTKDFAQAAEDLGLVLAQAVDLARQGQVEPSSEVGDFGLLGLLVGLITGAIPLVRAGLSPLITAIAVVGLGMYTIVDRLAIPAHAFDQPVEATSETDPIEQVEAIQNTVPHCCREHAVEQGEREAD